MRNTVSTRLGADSSANGSFLEVNRNHNSSLIQVERSPITPLRATMGGSNRSHMEPRKPQTAQTV